MFEVKKHKAIISGLHRIEDNYVILLNDGDNDIIYTGTNAYKNRILGVVMYEDDDEGYLRYIHTLITDDQYVSYLQKKLSFRQILDKNQSFYIVDKHYNGKEISANIVSIQDVPEDFLPTEKSFCPSFIKEPSLSYAVSLKGGKADVNLTVQEDLNNVNTHISNFMGSATDFLAELELSRHVYVEALPAGSFKIKFKIELDRKQAGLFSVPMEDISKFLLEYFVYVFEKLPNEKSGLFKNEIVESKDFDYLEGLLENLYTSNGLLPKPAINVEQKLIDNMNYSIEYLKYIQYGNSFERIEVVNYTSEGTELPFALIDENFIPSIQDKFFQIESEEDRIEIDPEPKTYSIQVYSLNKITGNGLADLHYKDGIYKVSIRLRGRTTYQNTIFTHNMDEKEPKLMDIKGIAKRVNDIVKEITYTFED